MSTIEAKCTIVAKHADIWRNLRAWGRSLDEVTIEVSNRTYPKRAGTCWPHQQRVVVYQQSRITDMLACVLHELAHAATIGNHHDATWQKVYADAVNEVTGIRIPSACDGDYEIMDDAARDAVRKWWRGSHHEFAAKLLGVMA